jgi:hypothetical protein
MGRKRKYKVMKLPSDFKKMECFILENREKIINHVVFSIDHAIENSLENIDVFGFYRSDYYITISRDTFLENIDHIYNAFIKDEMYEHCSSIIELKDKFLNHDNKKENIKRSKRSKSKNTSNVKNKKNTVD